MTLWGFVCVFDHWVLLPGLALFPQQDQLSSWPGSLSHKSQWIFYTDRLHLFSRYCWERGGDTVFSKCLWLETMKNQLPGLFLLAFLLLADWFVVRSNFLSGGGGTRVNRKWSKETSCLLNISKWVLLLIFFLIGSNIDLSAFVCKPNRVSCFCFLGF